MGERGIRRRDEIWKICTLVSFFGKTAEFGESRIPILRMTLMLKSDLKLMMPTILAMSIMSLVQNFKATSSEYESRVRQLKGLSIAYLCLAHSLNCLRSKDSHILNCRHSMRHQPCYIKVQGEFILRSKYLLVWTSAPGCTLYLATKPSWRGCNRLKYSYQSVNNSAGWV